MLSCHCGLDGHRLDCDHYRESTPDGSPAHASGCESPDPSPDCPRCAALTRERDEVYARGKEDGFRGHLRNVHDANRHAEAQRELNHQAQARAEAAERDLAQARQALEKRDAELLAYMCEDDNLPTYERGYADGRASVEQVWQALDAEHSILVAFINASDFEEFSSPALRARIRAAVAAREALVERGTSEQTDLGDEQGSSCAGESE